MIKTPKFTTPKFTTPKSRTAAALGLAVLATATTLAAGVGTAAAATKTEKVPGVTLQDLWMHCNAFGGDYSEGDGWALCILPTGQSVYCTESGCIMNSIATNPTGPIKAPIGPVLQLTH